MLPADDAAGHPVSLAACALHAGRWASLPHAGRPSRIIGAAARCRCVGASRDGWLALVAGDAAAPAGPLLLNPFTGEEIRLDESLYQPAHELAPNMVAVQRASDGVSYCEDTGPLLGGAVLVDVAYDDHG